ncbi:hypothetical protein TP47_10680 [Xanthomonas citri pv. aurantifolii]|nr:hypothetical protein TP50_20840 [Xanthomonas citri pv. aurantifolii]TBW97609.1 hypothetical protein TP47_10680 [Xanthomonas citri pv. aurantifolii]TBW99015.1 hypothetical protein TP49_05545 [Xanthomonas citri pv. aurantifolii]
MLACLRLAGSSNPNEAAAALRQARALMVKYGLSEADAAAADIRDASAATGFRGGMVPSSLLMLANVVADGYRCEVVISIVRTLAGGRTAIRFFGAGADAEIAAYAFAVLRRQLQAGKAKHLTRVRKRANKERRGEEFAFGWISAIARLFPKEALPDGRGQAISAAIAQRVGTTEKTTGKEIGKQGRATDNDRWAGYEAGRRAQLNQGLSEGQRKLEG